MDMEAYLGLALSEITKAGSYSQDRPPWPPEQELEALSIQSDGLFILRYDCHTLYWWSISGDV